MTTHRTLPSEVEPDGLADLIADCAIVQSRVIDLTTRRVVRVPEQRTAVVIDEDVVLMLDGFGDYGSC